MRDILKRKLEPWRPNLGHVPNPVASRALVNQSIQGNISPDTEPTRIGGGRGHGPPPPEAELPCRHWVHLNPAIFSHDIHVYMRSFV